MKILFALWTVLLWLSFPTFGSVSKLCRMRSDWGRRAVVVIWFPLFLAIYLVMFLLFLDSNILDFARQTTVSMWNGTPPSPSWRESV